MRCDFSLRKKTIVFIFKKIIKMDLGTAIIGLIFILVCTIPFVLISRSRRKDEKKLFISLKNLAEKQQSKITQHEVCSNYAIGIDETKNFVFFQLKKEKEIKPQFIDLSTIKKCKINNIGSATSNENRIIEQLNLELIPINKNKNNTVLEFYNSDQSYQLNGEFQSIEKWNKLINSKLKNH